LLYKVSTPPNTQTCKKKSFTTKARRRGNAAPFPSETLSKKIKNSKKIPYIPI
jgi:hypothetical protein